MARYAHITKKEFDEFMRSKNFNEISEPGVIEVVYERIAKNGLARMLVYSSISSLNNQSRKRGMDAIRVTLEVLRNGKWTHSYIKFKRVHRTTNWKRNLTQRLLTVAATLNPTPCPECGHARLLKKGQYGLFYGCVMWTVNKCKGGY